MKKPGRMRWNYQKPDPKMYLADGDTLWLYEPEDKQAFKQDLKASQLPAALAFLTGKGKLTDGVRHHVRAAVRRTGRRAITWWRCRPSRPSHQVKDDDSSSSTPTRSTCARP